LSVVGASLVMREVALAKTGLQAPTPAMIGPLAVLLVGVALAVPSLLALLNSRITISPDGLQAANWKGDVTSLAWSEIDRLMAAPCRGSALTLSLVPLHVSRDAAPIVLLSGGKARVVQVGDMLAQRAGMTRSDSAGGEFVWARRGKRAAG
jgi:hypothetical protein